MADWYVSATAGNDSTGDGSQSNPWKNIYYAYSQIVAGTNDEILCEDGTYDTEIGITVGANKPLIVKGISGDFEKVIIKPVAWVTSTYSTAYPSPWIYRYSSGGTSDVEFHDVTIILDQSHMGITETSLRKSFSVTALRSASDKTFRAANCLFIADIDNFSIGGVATLQGGNYEFYKCTFRNWKSIANNDTWYIVDSTSYNTIIKDCIFENCDICISTTGTATLTEEYNCFYGNTTDIDGGTIDSTSITDDPLFEAADSGVIESASPCVNAGTAVAGYVDSWGGPAPDIGCYEFPGSLLIYTGTWNNGSNSGTNYLGSSVISIGRISEALITGQNSPWCQQTTVVLDDSDSAFIGTLAKGTDWYQGTFNIWGNDGTSWTQIMTGFVPAKSWSYDYSQKVATLQVTSMLQRAAAVTMGFGSGAYNPSSNFAYVLGTITANSDGTVTITHYGGAPAPPRLNSYLWDTDSTGDFDPTNTSPGRLLSYQGWTFASSGTWNIDCQLTGGTLDWMSEDAIVSITVPYPNTITLSKGVADGYTGIDMFFHQAGSNMGLTWDSDNWAKFTSDLAIIPLACTPFYGTSLYDLSAFPVLAGASVGTAPFYYGGGLWWETMNDLMNSVGANWTVDGVGVIRAKVRRAAALEAVTGTVSFTDAEDEMGAPWTFTSTEGPALVMVEHEWDNNDERFTGTALSEGEMNTGDTMKLQAKWQRGIGGALLAERTMKWEQRIGRIFSLSYPVSYWGSFVPGSLVALANIPGALDPDFNATGSVALLTAGKYVVQARHYDYMEHRIVADLRQVPPLTGVFILDVSELDGPDKLY